LAEFILEARDVFFDYPDGTSALKGVSLGIEKGKKVAVLGPNGAGKSTLFLHFNGVYRPKSGKVFFSGSEVRYNHSSMMALRKNVGIVFQDPDAQLFSASVYQEISFGPLNLGLNEEQVKERVNRAMAATGITELGEKPTHLLSYGEKKLVSIADILAMEPSVIICDEPAAWLDPGHTARVLELFDRINRNGTTVVMSTHDVDMAYSWSEYVYVMHGGKIAGEGTPQAVFQDDGLLKLAGLQKPLLVDLSEHMRRKGLLAENSGLPRSRSEFLQLLDSR